MSVPILLAAHTSTQGINKPDVSLVYLFDIPDSMSELVQLGGRAGRDDSLARVVVLLHAQAFKQRSQAPIDASIQALVSHRVAAQRSPPICLREHTTRDFLSSGGARCISAGGPLDHATRAAAGRAAPAVLCDGCSRAPDGSWPAPVFAATDLADPVRRRKQHARLPVSRLKRSVPSDPEEQKKLERKFTTRVILESRPVWGAADFWLRRVYVLSLRHAALLLANMHKLISASAIRELLEMPQAPPRHADDIFSLLNLMYPFPSPPYISSSSSSMSSSLSPPSQPMAA